MNCVGLSIALRLFSPLSGTTPDGRAVLTQCCCSAGPASWTMAQQWSNLSYGCVAFAMYALMLYGGVMIVAWFWPIKL